MTDNFVLDILQELRASQYTPRAWVHFLHRSWRRSLEDIEAEPSLVLSWLRQTAAVSTCASAALVWHWRRFPTARRWMQLRRVGALLGLQQIYVLLHLGMTQPTAEAPRFEHLGVATFLSLVRGVFATLLCVAGSTDDDLYNAAIVVGAASDVADGRIARCSGSVSRMGTMIDSISDVCFCTTATVVAVRRGALPHWFGWLTSVRFLLPIGAGCYRYFWRAQTMEAEHTSWGKIAGIMLTLLLGLSTRSPEIARRMCGPVSCVLMAASAVQFHRAVQSEESGHGTSREQHDRTAWQH